MPGNPDAACDLVAEAIVDEYLRRDPSSAIRVSVNGGRGALFISGDVVSTADFDVASTARRALSINGILVEIEPFVSLEPATPDLSGFFLSGNLLPTSVTGYATNETPELLPQPVVLARLIAELLDRERTEKEDWFWLGSDAEIVVREMGSSIVVDLIIEHGGEEVSVARTKISELIARAIPSAIVRVNFPGPLSYRGLGNFMGSSGRSISLYGDQLPSGSTTIGVHPSHPEKGGMWLARKVARDLVTGGYANNALVQMTYEPGEKLPTQIRARSSSGKDLAAFIDPELYRLDRLTNEWARPGLSSEAARFGFVGLPGAPWESM